MTKIFDPVYTAKYWSKFM